MPAEWEPHEATWIAWPHNRDDWPGRFAPIPWVYGEIVRKLSRVEKVRILVDDRALERAGAHACCAKSGATWKRWNFSSAHQSRLDARLRPHLRAGTRAAQVALTAWRFNAWAKYDDWRHDARCRHLSAKR